MPSEPSPLTVIFVRDGEDVSEIEAKRAAAPGKVLMVKFVTPAEPETSYRP